MFCGSCVFSLDFVYFAFAVCWCFACVYVFVVYLCFSVCLFDNCLVVFVCVWLSEGVWVLFATLSLAAVCLLFVMLVLC